MTARQRLWLSRLFILLFLVITPLILTYAAGYHINWRYLKLERTGLLEIKTEPSGALINIEEIKAWLGKPKELITPIKLKNLRPGSYHINLSLTGYHNWQKTLVIRPAETTFAKNIRLFKQSNPQQLADLPLGSNLTTVDWPTDQSDLNLANKIAGSNSFLNIDFSLKKSPVQRKNSDIVLGDMRIVKKLENYEDITEFNTMNGCSPLESSYLTFTNQNNKNNDL